MLAEGGFQKAPPAVSRVRPQLLPPGGPHRRRSGHVFFLPSLGPEGSVLCGEQAGLGSLACVSSSAPDAVV